MYFWLYYAVWIITVYPIILCADCALTRRMKNKYFSVFTCVACYLFTAYFKLKTSNWENQTAYQLANVGNMLLLLYYIVLMHKDRLRDKITVFVVWFGVTLLDAALLSLLVFQKDSGFSVDFDSIFDLLKFTVANLSDATFLLFGVVIFLIYKRKLMMGSGVRLNLFLISQFIFMKFLWSEEFIEKYMTMNIISMSGIFVGYLADLLMFTVIENESEQEYLQREIQTVRQAMELESVRYEALQERRQELAKLRHDYNNQLIVVQLLLESGNAREAYEIASELKSRVNADKVGEV